MYLLPKRKLDDENIFILQMLNQQPAASITTNMIQEGAITIELIDPNFTLDDIADGSTYGRVLLTNLTSNALKIITAQTNLLDLVPATDNASDLGSDSKKFLLGYIKKAYHDTRLQVPVGANMYD